MATMTFISVFMAVLGMGIAISKDRQLPESVSAIVYSLGRGWQWLWSAWVMVVTITAMMPLLYIMPDDWQFVSFLCMACLVFVAVMPLVKKDMRKWHYILAVSGGILSQVSVAIVNPLCLLIWFAIIPLTANMWKWTIDKGVFIAEVLAMTAVYGCLL